MTDIAKNIPPKLMPLFSSASDIPMLISCNYPVQICNYRCPYCYVNFSSRDREKEKRDIAAWERAIERILSVPRPLFLAVGPEGEPLYMPHFLDTLRALSRAENVRGFWFPSNLSRSVVEPFQGLDPRKLGITGSFHPSQLKEPEEIETFFANCRWLIDHGANVVVNYILAPGALWDFPAWRDRFKEAGIPVTANVFHGNHEGKFYPDALSDDERTFIKAIFAEEPFIYDFMSRKRSSFGVKCTAGRDSISVSLDGDVVTCGFTRKKLGSIFDDELAIPAANTSCTTDWCRCHWTIGLMEDVVAHTKRTRGIFAFEERAKGEIGEHPFL